MGGSIRFSVIIPVYNRPKLVRRAIESVLNQTRPADELIVVDDGSTDATPDVLARFIPDIKLISQPNRGVSAARNTGIRAARGNWIALLDSDDEWLPDKLEGDEAFIRRYPQYRLFQSEEIWIRNGRRVNPKAKHQKYGGYIFRQSLPLCIISPSAAVMERSLLEETGLFDESFPVSEDYELWLRITSKYPVGLDKRTGILKYGGHEGQLSTDEHMNFYRIRALEKIWAGGTLNREQTVWLLRELIAKLTIWINGARKRGRTAASEERRLQRCQKELQRLLK